MSRKLFSYLGITLLIISTSQCQSRCSVKPLHDTTNVALTWQKEGKKLEEFNWDTMKGGKICYVPAEDAVYVIRFNNPSYRFTRTEAGELVCQSIAPPTDLEHKNIPAFGFAAGSKQKQNLFVGKVTEKNGVILLWEYHNDQWQNIKNPLAAYLEGAYKEYEYTTKQAYSSCTFEANNQLFGCLTIPFGAKIGSNVKNSVLFLTFDPTSKTFTPLAPLIPSLSSEQLKFAIGISPNQVLLGQKNPGNGVDLFSVFSIAGKGITALPKKFNHSIPHTEWEAFLLKVEDQFASPEPIFYSRQHCKFYKLNTKNELVETGTLPTKQVSTKSLILPFSNAVYYLTSLETAGSPATTVYYQGKLAFAK